MDLRHSKATLISLGAVDTTGTPAVNQIARFFDADTVQGDPNFTWTGTILNLGDGSSDINITGQETNTVDWIIGGLGASSRFQIGTIAGSARNVRFIRGGTAIAEITNAGISMQTGGMDLTWLSENGDIGASSNTFRPQNAYIVNNVVIGDDETSAYGLALGDNIQGHSPFQFLGQFTGDGAQNYTSGIAIAGNLTGANADTILAGAYLDNNLTTQGNTEVVTDVAQLWIDEPSITVGAGDTVTNAASLLINAAPTEGSNNYALFVRAGATNLGGTLDLTGAATFNNTLTMANAASDIIFSNTEQQILFQGCTTYFISNMDSPDEMMFGQGTVSVANTTFAVENGPGFRVRNRMVNEQYMDITARTTTVLTPSGSTATAVSLIPGGAFVVGVTTRVITGITGPTGFDIGDGTDVDRWGNSISGTLNTTSNKVDETAAGHGSFPAGSDIVLTSDGVDFTGGEVRVTVHYMTLQAPAS